MVDDDVSWGHGLARGGGRTSCCTFSSTCMSFLSCCGVACLEMNTRFNAWSKCAVRLGSSHPLINTRCTARLPCRSPPHVPHFQSESPSSLPPSLGNPIPASEAPSVTPSALNAALWVTRAVAEHIVLARSELRVGGTPLGGPDACGMGVCAGSPAHRDHQTHRRRNPPCTPVDPPCKP